MKLSPIRSHSFKFSADFYNKNITFRAQVPNNDKTPQEEPEQPQIIVDYSKIYQSPMLALRSQLLKDGFTLKDLTGWYVPDDKECPEKIDSQKTREDIEAMIKIYGLVKEKYADDEDVMENYRVNNEMAADFKEVYGIELDPFRGVNEFKGDIMALLSYSNRHNAPVVEMLLDDKDFLNSEISSAIWGMRDEKDVKYGLEVYNYAKSRGFYKEFSYPLAICMSEANEKNLPLIKKAIGEEAFLTEEEDFVLEHFQQFLNMDNELTRMYLEDDSMTLADVKDWFEEQ